MQRFQSKNGIIVAIGNKKVSVDLDKASVHYKKESDGSFTIQVPEFNLCAHGKTRHEALEVLSGTIEGYLGYMIQHNDINDILNNERWREII